ncbi:MAG: sensor histidine kinase [Alkalispirochaeta sp.]
MRSLFSRAFTAIVASHLILIIVSAGFFVFAVQRSIEDWNVHKGRRLQSLLVPEILRTYRGSGMLSEDAIHRGIQPFLTSEIYVIVTNGEREPVYFFSEGDRVSVHEPARINEELDAMEGEQFIDPVTLLDDGSVIGYLYADTLGFRQDLANQTLLRSLFEILIGGAATSVVFALLVAYLVSRLLTRQAQDLAKGLVRLAHGERDVPFEARGAIELRTIAASADRLQTQLDSEERYRRRWTQDIAHDLRTPIAALKTQFEGMADGYIAPTEEKFHLLRDEVLRIERLVNDLRELSRIESPEMILECTNVDARAFVANIRNRFSRIAERQGTTFTVRCEMERFRVDEHLFTRVISNLLDNAFRHVTDDGAVELLFRHVGNDLVCTVTNTGRIEEKNVELLFERFFRGETARHSHGSGLGLSIAKAIVELHDGSITMAQQGELTVVTIFLPQP